MADQHYHAFYPAIWSPQFQQYFNERLVGKSVYTDYSADIQGGGDRIYIPTVTQGFTPAAIPETSGAITPTALGDTKSTITLSNWYGSAFWVSKLQEMKTRNWYNLIDIYAKPAMYALADYFDTALFTAGVTSSTFTVGNSATALPSTTLEHALQIAESQSMPFDECSWVFTPKAYWGQLANVSKYYDAAQYGMATVPYGFVNKLYGIPAYVSNNLPALSAGNGRRSILAHKSSVCYAVKGPDTTELPAEALRRSFGYDIWYGITQVYAGRSIKIVEKT